MKKFLEVREFDSITGNADYKNDTYYKYLPEKIFKELTEFIHVYNGSEENADSLDFMKISYKRNVGDIISVKNYVGLIQLKSGFQIQILPKINFCEDDSNNVRTKRIFIKMLRSMKDFPSKVFNDSNLQVDKMNIYEIFINMYLREVRQLLKHGLKSAYTEQEENLKFYKGKLLVGKHVNYNCAHKERFYVSYDEFNLNRAENRLIKSTLIKLQSITQSFDNSKEIRQLLAAFEFVDASVNYQKDFSLVKIDRNMKDYEVIMKWSKVFLLNKSFTTFSGDDKSRALLFPMEKVYESYVARQMTRIFGEEGWNVQTQDNQYYLFERPRKQFALRPDIVIRKDNQTVVLDTKWKYLFNNAQKNYGISQSDMYQMYAYSKKYGSKIKNYTAHDPVVWLLYPINDEMRYCGENISFDSDDGTIVNVFFVDLEKIEDSINDLKEYVEKRKCFNKINQF